MAAKRTTPKAPAKTGALRRLSERERAAHEATGSGWSEHEVPGGERLLRTLTVHGISAADAETIGLRLCAPLGRYRMDAGYATARLAPAEVAEQAEMTARIAEALSERIRYMEPDLSALVTECGYRAGHGVMFAETGLEYLTRLTVYMRHSAAAIRAAATGKVPKRTGARNRLLAEAVDVLCNVCPNLSKVRARGIAREMLECWGVQAPTAPEKLRAAERRTK